MIRDKVLAGIIEETSEELNIPKEVVDLAYRQFWNFTKSIFEQLPVSEIKSPEDMSKYRATISVKGLGKFYINWDNIQNRRKVLDFLKERKNDKKSDKT